MTETILCDLCILFLQLKDKSSQEYKGSNYRGPRYAKVACLLASLTQQPLRRNKSDLVSEGRM